MKRIFIPIWVILCVQLNTYSQESLSPEISVTPPSPEVIAMNKFTEIPVSYYTGLPQISIPIHTIQMEKITVPISLDYHASGLRVDEYASWVGAGWSLSGTGVISRTIRGRADERWETPDYKGYFYANWLNNNGTVVDSIWSDCSIVVPTTMQPNTPQYTPINPSDYLTSGAWDTEPDEYNYSYPGGGGKFLFNHLRELIQLTPADVAIDHPFDLVSSDMYQNPYYWEIEGPNGTKYIYAYKAEVTDSSNPCATIGTEGIPMPDLSVSSDQSSWFLTRIENGAEWVNYSYTAITVEDSVKSSETAKIKIVGQGTNSTTTCRSYRSRDTYQLSSISSSNGYTIHFQSGSSRNDLGGSYNLDKVEVKYLSKTIKVVDLDNNAYFGTNSKLKLDGVDIQDSTSVTVQSYDLEYYSGSFPDQQTLQQDYWGYYNGAITNGSSAIPEWWNEDYHVNINSSISRLPSLTHTKIGTLKKITYPTGGSATFDYELHDYSGPNTEKRYSYFVEADGDEHNTVKDSVLFTVNQDCSISMVYGGIPDGLDAFAGLKKKNTSTGVYETYTPSDRNGVWTWDIAFRKNLEQGDYKLWAESWGELIQLEIFFEEKGSVKYQEAGGLRIKKISNYDPESDKTTHTLFDYSLDTADQSSGRLMTSPLRDAYYSTYIPGGEVIGGCDDLSIYQWETYVNVASYVQLPLGSVSGSHVGYSKVKVHKVTDEDLNNYTTKTSLFYRPEYAQLPDSLAAIGRVTYEYINDYPRTDTVGYNTDYPYVPFPDLDSKNGQLIAQRTYKNNGTSMSLQKETINSYDTLVTDTLRSYIFRRTVSTFCYRCGYDEHDDNTYLDWGKKVRLTKTLNRSYEGSKVFETATHFEYDYPNHLEVAASYTVESDGDTSRVEFKRDTNYPALINRLDKLVNGTLIDSDSLEYEDFLPHQYYKWDRVGSYDLQMSISRDPDGLVTYTESIPYNGGPPNKTSYLYSYGNAEKPVAQIQNIDTVQLDSKLALINATYSRSWLKSQTDETLIANTLDSLRAQLDDDQTITYYLYETDAMAFGPSKIVDTNGFSQRFEYDSFGRLEHVYDQDGNLVRKITYNLKNN